MRMTQIIGLTNAAKNFVSGLNEVDSDTHTIGMFDEKIKFRRWEYEDGYIREKLQASAWSSGPMLFYCLEYDFGNGSGAEILQWVTDPRVEDEADHERGAFWV